MARGKKTGGKDFVPGATGNPNGRPRIPQDIKEARLACKEEFDRILFMSLKQTKAQREARENDPEISDLERIVLKIIDRAADSGDTFRANFLLDRALGKVAEELNLKGSLHSLIVSAIQGKK